MPSCIALSDYSVILGTTTGIVFVYDKDTEKFHSLFREESKDFHNNSVTCIDVHPHRAEYVVTGHRMGQLVLLDLTKLPQSQSHVKMIKDHHKAPVVSVKFCDWHKERPYKDDKSNWLIVSCDTDGRVVVSKIYSLAFKILQVDKIVAVDPAKEPARTNLGLF